MPSEGVAARRSAGLRVLCVWQVDNFMQYGADLQWLSAFPAEAEVLYPPLTVSASQALCSHSACPEARPARPPATQSGMCGCSAQYLQPTGRVQLVTAGENSFKVIEVTPNIA